MKSEENLKQEFHAADGSFLIKARCELEWDKKAFSNLTSAMYDVADKYKDSESIPTWIAQGFWYCDTWIRDCTSHPSFPRPEKEYYEKSLELIHDLAYFLFIGESPYQDDALEKSAKGL